jgi:hypothetical protein
MLRVHILWSVLSNVLLLVLGVIFVAWKNDILIGLGGALVGAGVAGLMATLKTLDAWTQIHEVLCISKEHGFVSSEGEVVVLRRLFHHYHVTQLNDQWVWRYERVDFGTTLVPGALVAHIRYSGKAGEDRKSVMRGGVIDNRLLASNKEIGMHEEADVYLYPWMMEPGPVNIGFEVRVTLDRTSALMPGILAEALIGNWETVGTVTNPDTVRALNQCWAKHMKDTPIILPLNNGSALTAIRLDRGLPAMGKTK